MANTAFQIQYRQEYVAGFEQRQSLLRDTVTTEAVIKGQQATFLIADSGGKSTVTRGVDGLIPYYSNDLTQVTATLSEEHAPFRMTNFNVEASQGDQRRIMQENSMAVVNRKIDDQIINSLNAGTNDTGAAVKGTVSLFQRARVILGNNAVPWDGNICLLASPAFLGYLEQTPEFTKAEYVNLRPYAGDDPSFRDMPMAYKWRNVTIVEHPNLPGVGTSAEKCFLFHKSAIGHAVNMNEGEMNLVVGYNEEQDYSYSRATKYMGAKLLQNSGVVVINHDGSEYVAE